MHKFSNEMEPYYMIIKSEINTIELFYTARIVSLHKSNESAHACIKYARRKGAFDKEID